MLALAGQCSYATYTSVHIQHTSVFIYNIHQCSYDIDIDRYRCRHILHRSLFAVLRGLFCCVSRSILEQILPLGLVPRHGEGGRGGEWNTEGRRKGGGERGGRRGGAGGIVSKAALSCSRCAVRLDLHSRPCCGSAFRI